MAAKTRPLFRREAYQKAIAQLPDAKDSVTEKKSTVVTPDDSDTGEHSDSPLSDAFQKALHKGLDTDEHLDGEEDSPDYIPPHSRDKKPEKKKETKPDEKEEEGEEKEAVEVLKDDKDTSKEKPKKKGDSLSDEDVEGIDETTITDKLGRPPSREAWATVKLLKQKIADDRASHTAKIEELGKKTVEVEKSDQYITLQKEHDALKKKLDEKYFEESPDFINTFVRPFEEKEKEVAEWLGTADVEAGSAEHVALSSAVGDLQKAMMAGKKTDYFKAAAQIAKFLPEGVDQQMLISVTEMFPLYQKRKEGFSDKDKARKAVTSEELNQVNGAASSIDKTMDALFESYEADNSDILKFYRSDKVKELIPYDEIVGEGKKTVKALIRDLIATRRPSDKLVRVLTDAVLKPFKDKEVEALRAALQERNNVIANLNEELGKKKGILKKLGTTTSTSSRRAESEDDDEKISSTPLTDRFKEMSRR